MDFGAIGKGLNVAASKVNLGPADVLKGFISDSGIKLSAADLKSIIDNPQVKTALTEAIKKIAMSKLGIMPKSDQTAVNQNLGLVADKILEKAPDTDMTKTEIAGKLQDTIKDKLGM